VSNNKVISAEKKFDKSIISFITLFIKHTHTKFSRHNWRSITWNYINNILIIFGEFTYITIDSIYQIIRNNEKEK